MAQRALLATAALVALSPLALALTPSSAAASTPATGPSGYVYVTNLDQNVVTAISPHHQTTVIANSRFNGPLGIAITPDGSTAYVTNSLGNTITPIDLADRPAAVEPSIVVGDAPAAIAITPDGSTAYVSDFNSNTVTPVNLRTSPPTPEKPIRVGDGPWSIAVTPDGAQVIVSNSESDSVSVIDAATRSVTTVVVGHQPGAIAVSPDARVAYVAAGDQITPVRLTGGPSAEAPIEDANGPVGVAIIPDGSTAYAANANNTVTPINLRTSPPTPETTVAVSTLSQPDGITVNPNGTTAYAANANNTVTPINLRTSPPTPDAPIEVGSATFGIAVAPDQAPVARLSVHPGVAGRATTLSATGSQSSDGAITRYRWHFGDGTSATTAVPRVTHVYARPGNYRASVVETSADGTSTTTTFTGQTVSNHGSASAVAELSFSVRALLSTTPSSGAPGEAITLRDGTFENRCRPVYVFFDGKLISQTSPRGSVLDDASLVVPGDAPIGVNHLELSCATKGPWLISTPFTVVNVANHLAEFSIAMPNPRQLAGHLAASGALGILLLILSRIITAGFPSEWLDSTYADNRERIQARARKRFPKLFIDRDAERTTVRRVLGGTAIFIGFLAFASLINSFLDPGFGLNRTTLWLFIGQAIGVAIVTIASQLPIFIGGVREHRRVHLQVLIGGFCIAIVCVAVSRSVGLSPGYCYGLIAVFHLRPETSSRDWGRLHAIASVCLMAVATAAFFLTVPVFREASSANPNPFWLILDPALNVTFLGGFSGLAFSMFPLPFLTGRHIAQWSKAAWAVISTLGMIGFLAVLLTPGSGTPREISHVGLIPVFAAFVGFGLISLAFMLYFHLRPSPPDEREREPEPEPEPVPSA